MGSSFLLFESYFYLYCERPDQFPGRHMPDIQPGPPEEIPLEPPFSGNTGPGLKPSMKSFILYSIVTTIICCFGIFGNIISLAVLRRKELVGSVYTYLAVLAATDLVLSVTFFVGGLARGALYSTQWGVFDTLIGLPLGGTINSMGVMATVGVTIDRIFFLWNPVQCTRPKFCNPRIARLLMAFSLVICILLNLPYCFIFDRDLNGNLITTNFFHSRMYSCYNWFMLIVLTIIPGIILILGNGFLIMSLQKASLITKKCNGKRRKEHTNLTVTLISIIILFIVTEIPSNLVSRTRAVTLIFFGDSAHPDSNTLEVIRAICTIMGAINVTINFLFYYLLCPAFCRALKNTFQKSSTKKTKNVHVNVIMVNDDKLANVKSKVLQISNKSISSPLFEKDKSLNLVNIGSKQIDSEYVKILENFKDENFSISTVPADCYEHESFRRTMVRQLY